MQKIKTRGRTGLALISLLLLTFLFLALSANCAAVGEDSMWQNGGNGTGGIYGATGTDGAGGAMTAVPDDGGMMPGGRAIDGANGANGANGAGAGANSAAATGGMTGGAWGVVIAVGIAALAVALIFLFVPRSDSRRKGERRDR